MIPCVAESANTGDQIAKPKPKRKPPHSAWKPGQSGNPAGVPRAALVLRSALINAGMVRLEDGRTVAEHMAAKLWQMAYLEGDVHAARLLIERNLGKVPDVIDTNVTLRINRGPIWKPRDEAESEHDHRDS